MIGGMPDHSHPLTDDQIQQSIKLQIQDLLNLGLDFVSLERALLNKGILTQDDIELAKNQIKQESGEYVVKIADAIRKGPDGGVQ